MLTAALSVWQPISRSFAPFAMLDVNRSAEPLLEPEAVAMREPSDTAPSSSCNDLNSLLRIGRLHPWMPLKAPRRWVVSTLRSPQSASLDQPPHLPCLTHRETLSHCLSQKHENPRDIMPIILRDALLRIGQSSSRDRRLHRLRF